MCLALVCGSAVVCGTYVHTPLQSECEATVKALIQLTVRFGDIQLLWLVVLSEVLSVSLLSFSVLPSAWTNLIYQKCNHTCAYVHRQTHVCNAALARSSVVPVVSVFSCVSVCVCVVCGAPSTCPSEAAEWHDCLDARHACLSWWTSDSRCGML